MKAILTTARTVSMRWHHRALSIRAVPPPSPYPSFSRSPTVPSSSPTASPRISTMRFAIFCVFCEARLLRYAVPSCIKRGTVGCINRSPDRAAARSYLDANKLAPHNHSPSATRLRTVRSAVVYFPILCTQDFPLPVVHYRFAHCYRFPMKRWSR